LEGVVAAQDEDLEDTLWAGVRALEESAATQERLAEKAASRGWTKSLERFQRSAAERRRQANALRIVVQQALDHPPQDSEAGDEAVH
jgi:two-component system chemotaxis response regulator CheB